MTMSADDNDTVVYDSQGARQERLALILDRYVSELEKGGVPPDVETLVAEHPDLAEEIRSYVDSFHVLHQMTTGLRPGVTGRDARGAATTAPTKRLGDFEIVREVGRGGMGIVYEARQLSLNRQVALKVLPFAAMLDERQIARFRTEAQAAAQLHHPNIVPVYAVGQERGVHYFAMQFVSGQSLEGAINELRGAASHDGVSGSFASHVREVGLPDELDDAARAADTEVATAFSTKVSTRSRTYCRSVARLMVQAAEAIQHAHEFGVVHRDVKPSNLLLDRNGKLWVTDFGLARIQTGSGVTITGDVVGTLRYMSPEQAAGDAALIDARTDVYSLGATLYELLTLEAAHRGSGRQELLRHIETAAPVKPRALNAAVPFDLETIVLRALAKSRDERYVTARQFADDLRRFLDGKPTLAQRPTQIDRAAKWALRHRRMVTLAGAFLVVLTIVSAGSALMIAQAHRRTEAARLVAEHNLERAEEHFQQARDVVDRFGSGLAGELAQFPGSEPLRHALLDESLRYYRQFIKQAATDTRLAGELATAHFKAAAIAEALGDRAEALAMCREAVRQFDALAKGAPASDAVHVDRAKGYNSLGHLLAAEGKADEAFAAYNAAISQQQALRKSRQDDVPLVRSLAESYSNQGLLEGQLGRIAEARVSLRASIDLLDRLSAGHADDERLKHDLAIGYNNLSFVERNSDWAAAAKASDRAIEILEELSKADAASLECRSDLALCYNNRGAIQGHRQEWAAASESYRAAIRLQEQLVRQAPAVVLYRRNLAVSLNNLGQSQQESGELAEAVETFAKSQAIVSLLVEDYPNELMFRSLCGAVFNNRAMALEAAENVQDALTAYEAAIKHQRIAFERAPRVTEYRESLSKHFFNYGRALRAVGRPDEAAKIARERAALWPAHGDHLGGVAVELAEAAAAVRKSSKNPTLAMGLEEESAQMLREAAAAGGNIAALRNEPALKFLHDDQIWGNLKSKTADPAS